MSSAAAMALGGSRRSRSRADWLIPSGLIVLALVPSFFGTLRVVQLGRGAAITPENARFFTAPTPVVLHIVSAIIFCVVGAFQFSPGFRRRRPDWHRAAGRMLVGCGLLAASSGMWMTWTYPYAPGDGDLLYAIRLVVGPAMFLSILLGLRAIRRREFRDHEAWMMRGYAIGQGAGTQVLTTLAWVIFFGMPDETERALTLGAGWGINVLMAEWIIRRGARRAGAKAALVMAGALSAASRSRHATYRLRIPEGRVIIRNIQVAYRFGRFPTLPLPEIRS